MSGPNDYEKQLVQRIKGWLLKAFLLVFVGWLMFGFLPAILATSIEKAASFGDSFGFVNALFSGLALAGVVVAISLQTMELGYQRQELEESQKAWRDSADAQVESHKALRDSAEAQASSNEALKEQAEAAFLAAYLNALTALLSSPPPDHLNPAQVKYLNRVSKIVDLLEEQASEILGHKFVDATAATLLAERLRSLLASIRVQWDATKSGMDDSHYDSGRELLAEFDREFRRMIPELNQYSSGYVSRVVESLEEVRGLPNRITGTRNEVFPAFANYWNLAKRLFDSVDALLRTLDSSAKKAAREAEREKRVAEGQIPNDRDRH